jgi:hypothetical protein
MCIIIIIIIIIITTNTLRIFIVLHYENKSYLPNVTSSVVVTHLLEVLCTDTKFKQISSFGAETSKRKYSPPLHSVFIACKNHIKINTHLLLIKCGENS